MNADAALPRVPRRPTHGHKGTFGTVLVVGGCAAPTARMIGAPALAATGALRVGCGRARVLVPTPIIDAVIGLCSSATGACFDVNSLGAAEPHHAAERFDAAVVGADCVVVGPGMGFADGAIAHTATLMLRALRLERVPVVVDADSIHALAATNDFARDIRAQAILTPHLGEFANIARAVGLAEKLRAPTTPAQRTDACGELARRIGCIVVLKGAGTVVSNGIESWTCPHGHVCLATAGTGDVLAGAIAGVIAGRDAVLVEGSDENTASSVVPAHTGAARSVNVPTRVAKGVDGIDMDQLRALAAAKLGKAAPSVDAAAQRSAPATNAPPPTLSILDAVKCAVKAHSLAGEAWATKHGATGGALASEIADLLPAAMERLRAGSDSL